MPKSEAFKWVDQNQGHLKDLAQTIWETPELPLEEYESAKILIEALEDEGFVVDQGIGGLPTAFKATYGKGDPTIGILGEYDALPGLSQKVQATPEPAERGAPGHGCGHNLYGVGSLGGALAAKQVMKANGLDGTVQYFGCPAEETLVGKVYMAKAGAFDELDAVLRWHPAELTTPTVAKSSALDSVKYHFEGKPSHSATTPEAGRSGLDAVQLMNLGVEFMREHIIDDASIHYVIIEGGDQPNVIPSQSTVWYYVRAPSRQQVEQLRSWLDDIAAGSAQMTQTDLEIEFLTGCYDRLPNESITEVIWENMQEVGPIEFTEEERQFAQELKETVPDETIETQLGVTAPDHLRDEIREQSLYPDLIETFDKGMLKKGSGDSNDVSWIAPKGKFNVTARPTGIPGHTWQVTAGNAHFGRRSVVFAAKVIAGSTLDLITDPETLREIQAEFKERLGNRTYESPIPDGVEPPTPEEAAEIIAD